MAKSKAGGTRTYLRGRVGSDVYSIGKDGKGKKQQVVRALAESVANPKTIAQNIQRMCLDCLAQNAKGLKVIILDSFDNVPNGQPSLSEFTRSNMALVQSYANKEGDSNQPAVYPKYGQKNVVGGFFLIARGKAKEPAAFQMEGASGLWGESGQSLTAKLVREQWELSGDEYATVVQAQVGSDNSGKYLYARIKYVGGLADDTVITSANLGSLFTVEGNHAVNFWVNNGLFGMNLSNENIVAGGVIFSRKSNGKYIHNNAKMTGYIEGCTDGPTALATWPVGEEKFLNGGEL